MEMVELTTAGFAGASADFLVEKKAKRKH